MTCIFDRWPEAPVPAELIETRKPETMTKTLTPFQNWWADLVEGFDPESVEVEELAKLAFEAGQQNPTTEQSLAVQQPVNAQMLKALKEIKSACAAIPEDIEGYLEPLSDALVVANDAIAAAEAEQQPPARSRFARQLDHADKERIKDFLKSNGISPASEPVALQTQTYPPRVSREHIEALARACKLIPQYTNRTYNDAIIGFAHVLFSDPSVQESFVRENSHLLYTTPQPAVPEGMALVPARLSRQHIGQIVDDVFDGALEDESVISDIWAAGIAAAKGEA